MKNQTLRISNIKYSILILCFSNILSISAQSVPGIEIKPFQNSFEFGGENSGKYDMVGWIIENNSDDTVFYKPDLINAQLKRNNIDRPIKKIPNNPIIVSGEYYNLKKEYLIVLPHSTNPCFLDFSMTCKSAFNENTFPDGKFTYSFSCDFVFWKKSIKVTPTPIIVKYLPWSEEFLKENEKYIQYMRECKTCTALDYLKLNPTSIMKNQIMYGFIGDSFSQIDMFDKNVINAELDLVEKGTILHQYLLSKMVNYNFSQKTEQQKKEFFETVLNHKNVNIEQRKDLKRYIKTIQKIEVNYIE